MLNKKEEKEIFYFFEGGIIFKGIQAILETISGFFILFVSHNFIIQTIVHITNGELAEESNDFFANYLVTASQNFSLSSKYFLAFYLLSHGILKIVLVIALWKKKIWAYPASIIVFSLFIIYQIARFIYTHSIWLIVFTVMDILILWLIWHEYKIQKKQ